MNDEIKILLKRVKHVAVNATESAGQAINTAGRKANSLLDITRCTLQISDTRGSIDKLYTEIGALVYQTHIDPETSSEGLQEKLEEITALYTRIAELEAKAEALKQKAACPVCGKGYDKSDSFCRDCGHAIGKRNNDTTAP